MGRGGCDRHGSGGGGKSPRGFFPIVRGVLSASLWGVDGGRRRRGRQRESGRESGGRTGPRDARERERLGGRRRGRDWRGGKERQDLLSRSCSLPTGVSARLWGLAVDGG